MTSEELKAARRALKLSAEGFARLVGVQSGRTVRRWERGDRDVPGTVERLLDALAEMGQERGEAFIRRWSSRYGRGVVSRGQADDEP